jgi:molybdopterin molybdotransferase
LGRVLARDIVSEVNVPSANLVFLDGYALRAEDVQGASAEKPVRLKIAGKIIPGQPSAVKVSPGQAVYVSHYMEVPEGADVVVSLESLEVGDGEIIVNRPFRAGLGILPKGDDIREGTPVLRKGCLLRPQDLALLLALDKWEVPVVKKPKVAVISVGNELVKLAEKTSAEAVGGFSMLISKLLFDLGALPMPEVVGDEVASIREALLSAAEKADLILTIGGLSVGKEDFVPQALNALDPPGVIVRGVALIPPWLTTLAVAGGKPVVCLPGRYVPLIGTFYYFAVPVLQMLSGVSASLLPVVKAKMGHDAKAGPGRSFFMPVRLEREGATFTVKSTFRGPHPISSLTKAHGFIIIQAGTILKQGEEVEVILFSRTEAAALLSQDFEA